MADKKGSLPKTTVDIGEKVDMLRVLQRMKPQQQEPKLQGSDLNEWRKMQLNPDRKDQGIYRTIGARNPYALAERMQNTGPIEWSTNDFMANREKLIQILTKRQKTGPVPIMHTIHYEELFNFDLAIKSPLYVARPALPSGLIATEESPCTKTGDYWKKYFIPNTTTLAPYCKVIKGGKSEVIDDPVQGCSENCYFIAALCSVAWCYYPNFPVSATTTQLGETYDITFHYPGGNTVRTIKISSDLVLDATGKSPVFSRPSNSYEVWPAIYEKAYGIFKLLIQSELPYQGNAAYKDLPRPDIPTFHGGNPLESLEHLTGLSWTLGTTYFNTKDIPGQSFTKISAAIDSTDNINGITKYPMVAWTYLNASEANAAHPPPDPPISYSNEIFVANHSYSILGTLIKNSKNYIVLRNPWGRLWGADPNDTTNLYTGTWSPPGFSKSLPLEDGIFALDANWFERYFTAFGWVQ